MSFCHLLFISNEVQYFLIYVYMSKQFLGLFCGTSSRIPNGTDLTFISDFPEFLAISPLPWCLAIDNQGHTHEKCHGRFF